MWILEFLFFSTTLVIGWTMFGYFLKLFFMGLFRRREPLTFPSDWPMISVVVPCYNEEGQIISKLENLRSFNYSRDRFEVVFADGGSSDETVGILRSAIREDEPIRVVECPSNGKINQLNFVLPQLRGEIVVNTDVDAHLIPDALRCIAAEFAASPDVCVVGAYSYPVDTMELESYYWDAQNKGRFLESDAKTSSIVIAQCYAFKRDLMKSFPVDVVADDIYVAYLANTHGYRTVYSRHVVAMETRSPRNMSEFLPHKFRKSNAFLRESLRFLHRLPEMNPFCKMVFITRTLQQLFLPWTVLLWILLAGSLITLFRVDIVVFGAAFLVVLLLVTNRVFAAIKLPSEDHHYSITTVVQGFVLTIMILMLTGLSYPFFRQGSSYARLDPGINAKGRAVPE